MFEHDRIDILEEIYINETNASIGRDTCHYWHFLN